MKKVIILFCILINIGVIYAQKHKNKTSFEKNVFVTQVQNDDNGKIQMDRITKLLKSKNINCIWAGSIGQSMNVSEIDLFQTICLITDSLGTNYLNLKIIEIADSVAKAELKMFNETSPRYLSQGQLSLQFYNKSIEPLPQSLSHFLIKYTFNQDIGGKVLFTTFGVEINILSNKAQFIKQNLDENNIKELEPNELQHLIYRGKFIEVYVEKAIYHHAENKNFLMKFSLKNISNKVVGIDLTNFWKVIYPNQWGIYRKPYREVINEEQIIPDASIDKKLMLKKFKNNTLTQIKPFETIEYFRDWNGSGEKVNLKNKDEYFIITVDGQLFITNGTDFEQVKFNNTNENKRVVVLRYPLIEKNVPSKSLIILEN